MANEATKIALQVPEKGAMLQIEQGLDAAIIGLLKRGLEGKLFDAALLPVLVPAGDSYAWVLMENDKLLENAHILPPVMPVQGARALSSITKHGKAERRIAAIMRPCEVRATIELAKLNQINLENIYLISVDCPGVLPLKEYLRDKAKSEKSFYEAVNAGKTDVMRQTCQSCVHFSMTASDLHIATIGMDGGAILVHGSEKGKRFMESLNLKFETDTSNWQSEVKELTGRRLVLRANAHKSIKSEHSGMDNLMSTFGKCISCHNCMSVCPICYCRRCYFESEAIEFMPQQYFNRAKQKGFSKIPHDTLLFHIGRMSHMTLSCVSCGCCEDACPVSIPVSQLFAATAEDTQKAFDYIPGRNIDEELPLRMFIKDKELTEIERICKDPLE